MQIVNKGITRLVILIGDYAIKIPNYRYEHNHFLKGCTANWNEREFYKNRCSMRLWVAPSYFCSWFGLFQIQARCIEMDRHLTNKEKSFYKPLCGTDFKKENFGYYKDRLVCLDYPDVT